MPNNLPEVLRSPHQSASRAELVDTIRRLEIITDRLSTISQDMATDKVHNKFRDDTILTLQAETKTLRTELHALRERITYYAGGAMALFTALQLVGRKLGFY